MLSCECGYIHDIDAGARSLSSMPCPKCGRKIKKQETWLFKIGDLNALEAVKFQGREKEYLRKRKLKHGY